MPLFRIFFGLALLASFAANAATVTKVLSFTATDFTPLYFSTPCLSPP